MNSERLVSRIASASLDPTKSRNWVQEIGSSCPACALVEGVKSTSGRREASFNPEGRGWPQLDRWFGILSKLSRLNSREPRIPRATDGLFAPAWNGRPAGLRRFETAQEIVRVRLKRSG